MTRHEEHQSIDRDQLKKEIRAELVHEERHKRIVTALVVVALFVILLAAPFVAAGVLVAKSGILPVPVLSNIFYRPIEPSAKVSPLVGTDPSTIFNTVIARADYDPVISSLKLYVTEQELTTVLDSSLSQVDEEDMFLPIDSVQSLFGPDKIELFALTKRDDGVKVPILVELKPVVQQGQLKLEASNMTIGSLKLPDFLAQTFVNATFRDLSSSLTEVIGARGDLKQVTVTPDRLEALIIANGL